MPGSKEESSFADLRTPSIAWSTILLIALSLAFAWLSWTPFTPWPTFSWMPGGAFGTAFLFFLLPAFPGALAAAPISHVLGGKLNARRALFSGVLMYVFVGVGLALWRLFVTLHGAYPLEGVLLALFGASVWFRQMVLSGISGPTPLRAVPQSLVAPAFGVVLTWGFLGVTLVHVGEGIFFLLLPLGAIALLIEGANRPMVREFGESGVAILRPLIDHINERDPEASRRMEEFLANSPSEADLTVSALHFRGEGTDLLWIAPAIHPGPFAELGASDLPNKVVSMLSGAAQEIVVLHAPCTHDQNIPTTEEVRRVMGQVKSYLPNLSAGPSRASPLVLPHAGSMVRAQVLGDTVLLVVSRAPEASDDIDYAVGEMVREEARRQGFRLGIIVDAHNVYVRENMGTVPFGSPQSFKLIEDAKAAMRAAQAAVKEGPVRVGVGHRRGYTTQDDGLGKEGISVTVVEAAGSRTAYAVLDGNNLLHGFREKLLATLKESVDEAEVMTTDNHVVHEVANGINPIGKLRSAGALSKDLHAVVTEALSRMHPVTVSSGEVRVPRVKVMGHATTIRLMTVLNDSFAAFWVLMPTTLLLTVAGELLVLALFP